MLKRFSIGFSEDAVITGGQFSIHGRRDEHRGSSRFYSTRVKLTERMTMSACRLYWNSKLRGQGAVSG